MASTDALFQTSKTNIPGLCPVDTRRQTARRVSSPFPYHGVHSIVERQHVLGRRNRRLEDGIETGLSVGSDLVLIKRDEIQPRLRAEQPRDLEHHVGREQIVMVE